MKVLLVHNQYRIRGGEDAVMESTVLMLNRRGIDVSVFTRSSEIIGSSLLRKVYAFGSGVYSFSAASRMSRMISQERPDVIHVHNLYPLISASVLAAGNRAGIPIVMTCHNFRLMCPIGTYIRNGRICELCNGGREYWCALVNCRSNIAESFAYSFRSILARTLRLFEKNVTLFIVLSSFARRRLIDAGFPGDRMVLLPNAVSVPDSSADPSRGEYIAFAGRISDEKGVDTLLSAARITGLPVRLAGDYSARPDLAKAGGANVAFVGQLGRKELDIFYRKSRCLVVPSKWYEMMPIVLIEAMSYGLPVIVSDIGGLTEVVDDGVTGLLFEAGNGEDLSNKMKTLWSNPTLCQQMGQAGRAKVIREYSEDVYFRRLIAVYDRAIEITGAKKEGVKGR